MGSTSCTFSGGQLYGTEVQCHHTPSTAGWPETLGSPSTGAPVTGTSLGLFGPVPHSVKKKLDLHHLLYLPQ